jgi:uncharacterized protein (TIGR02147 family)
MKSRKSIYEYGDYRAFLRDFYDFSKATNKSFSFRSFSKLAGFQSPSVLKRVMTGERNLSKVSILRFAKALGLSESETQFFKNLVLFCQATTAEEKHLLGKQILRSHTFKRIHPVSEAQFNYFSSWYMVAIRELVDLRNFQEDPEWIASRIQPRIEPHQAKRAIEELLLLGMIKRDADGRLKVTSTNISTPDEVASSIVAQFHRELMKKAMDSIDTIPRERREISALAMGVSEKTMQIVKRKIQAFRQELVSIVSCDEAPDMVYQLNFQFFPLTQESGEGNEK